MFDWLYPIAFLSAEDFAYFKSGFLYSFLGIIWWPFLLLGYLVGIYNTVIHGTGGLWMTFQGATVAVISALLTRVSLFFYLKIGFLECIGWPFNKG